MSLYFFLQFLVVQTCQETISESVFIKDTNGPGGNSESFSDELIGGVVAAIIILLCLLLGLFAIVVLAILMR